MARTNFLILILMSLFLLNFVSATCTSTQININSASLQDLDKLTGVGPATAQKIIDARPFSTLDDLLNVSGIGDKKISDIKSQGLACVSSSEGETVTDINENDSMSTQEEPSLEQEDQASTDTDKTISNKVTTAPEVIQNTPQEVQSENIINLNSGRDISTKESVVYESRNELVKKYAIYAFAIFLVFIIAVLLLKG